MYLMDRKIAAIGDWHGNKVFPQYSLSSVFIPGNLSIFPPPSNHLALNLDCLSKQTGNNPQALSQPHRENKIFIPHSLSQLRWREWNAFQNLIAMLLRKPQKFPQQSHPNFGKSKENIPWQSFTIRVQYYFSTPARMKQYLKFYSMQETPCGKKHSTVNGPWVLIRSGKWCTAMAPTRVQDSLGTCLPIVDTLLTVLAITIGVKCKPYTYVTLAE